MDRTKITETLLNFHCPRFEELPEMDLYLEQVLTLVNTRLMPILAEPVTGAMITNYVKNGAVPSPNKKKYTREHLVYIIVTSILKPVIPIQQIGRFFNIQKKTYPVEVAYDYFCTEYENAIKSTFLFTGEAMPRIETKLTDETILLRAVVLSAVNRLYAEKLYFNI